MKRTRMERVRLSVICALVCLFFAIAVVRLVHLQVIEHSRYSDIVRRQSSGKVTIPAERGLIYDRHGWVVANNITRSSLYAYPLSTREISSVARYLEKLFHLRSGTAASTYGLKERRFRWIKRRMPDSLTAHIARTAPPGLFLRTETQRQYPWGLVGKQILGFTDIDNCGQAGIELAYDSLLAGRRGLADIRRDGLRRLYRVNESAMVKPVAGKSLVLTVDWRLQEILEKELRLGVEEYHAKSGMGAFVDCRSGEILATAHFDPTESDPRKPVKLRTATDQFEPGSIFKAFTAAAILEAGLVDFNDTTFCEEGRWRVGRRILHDDKELGWLTFRQIMELSSNIGIAKYAIELGGDELYQTACRFGFGEKCRLGFGGETRGRVFCPEKWSDYTVSALAMGHSIAVTCLQMTMAFASIANGGELLRPSLLLCSLDGDGAVTDWHEPDVVRRIMDEESTDTLRAILRGVVQTGTAQLANSSAVPIAGKTGTAEIPDLKRKRYHKNKFMASFAGFFPSEDPRIAGIVVYREPKPIHYGGHTAGPTFRRIVESYMVLNPDGFSSEGQTLVEASNAGERVVEVPDLVGRSLRMARSMAEHFGVALRANADSGLVTWQYPPADRLVFPGDEVLIAVANASNCSPVMVDLRGLSIRQASAYLSQAGIKGRVTGHGRVVRQSLAPGDVVPPDAVCWLECQPAT